MLGQASFSDLEYANKKRRTRRELFLAEMDAVVPWPELLAVVEPHYPRTGGRGRPPVGLAAMLRIYFLQQWFAPVRPTDGGRALRHRELALFRGFFQRHGGSSRWR